MPSVSVSIAGISVSSPGVYYQDRIQPLIPAGNPTGPLIFLAPSYGGQPFVAVNYTDANSLVQSMRGAPAADYVNFMFNPSSQLNGAQLVTLIDISPSTVSSATMLSTGGMDVIDLVSISAGASSNLLSYSVANSSYDVGGNPVGKLVTITDNLFNIVAQGDNLGGPFQLGYNDPNQTGATPSYTVTTIGNISTNLTISSPNPGETIVLDLTTSAYSNVSQIVAFINSTGTYSALVSGNGNLPSSMLDAAAGIYLFPPVPDTPTGVIQYQLVTAILGDVVNFVNTKAASLALATIHAGVFSGPGYTLQNIGVEYFTGGTNVVPSIADYASGFGVALNNPAWTVIAVPPSDADIASLGTTPAEFNYNIDLLGVSHANTAGSIPYRRWRRYVTGSILGETAVDGTFYCAQNCAIRMNSYAATYCYPGIQRTDPNTGLNRTYSGKYVAAAAAGMMTGNSINTPLTNKQLNGNGVEFLLDLSVQNILQNSGVMLLNFPIETRIPTFLSDVTTWQGDSNNANVFNQQVACRFGLAYSMTRTLQPYVGTVMSAFDLARVRNATVSLLNSLIYNGSNVGLLSGWLPSTLFLTFDSNTQTLTVTVSVALVAEVRFIPVTVSIVPPNLQITATVNNVITTTITD